MLMRSLGQAAAADLEDLERAVRRVDRKEGVVIGRHGQRPDLAAFEFDEIRRARGLRGGRAGIERGTAQQRQSQRFAAAAPPLRMGKRPHATRHGQSSLLAARFGASALVDRTEAEGLAGRDGRQPEAAALGRLILTVPD
jgi:hypothetical protein